MFASTIQFFSSLMIAALLTNPLLAMAKVAPKPLQVRNPDIEFAVSQEPKETKRNWTAIGVRIAAATLVTFIPFLHVPGAFSHAIYKNVPHTHLKKTQKLPHDIAAAAHILNKMQNNFISFTYEYNGDRIIGAPNNYGTVYKLQVNSVRDMLLNYYRYPSNTFVELTAVNVDGHSYTIKINSQHLLHEIAKDVCNHRFQIH